MKKWLIAFAVLFLLLLISTYFLIPSNLVISKSVAIECNADAAFRVLSDENSWNKWWPVSDSLHHPASDTNKTVVYNKEVYKLKQLFTNGAEINIRHNESTASSSLLLFPLRRDSVIAQWNCTIPSSHNPFKRVAEYLHAVNIKKNMDTILNSMRAFLEIPKNVYGINIRETSTTDTLLVAAKSLLHNYPSTADIYKSVDLLKNYINASGAMATGFPMLNVTPASSSQFQMMVALPVNKKLNGNGVILFRQMIPGNFLVTEVRGGLNDVENARKQLHYYMNDYSKTSMAIPFDVLITDRNIETDTSEWVTKLYEPVMK